MRERASMTDSRDNNGAGVLDTVNTASRSQDWTLDALGNWSSLSTDGTAQSRTHNSQNQITSIQTQTAPTYDSNGDTTKDNAGQQYTFDAWNHMRYWSEVCEGRSTAD
jgi:hypothetical protein